MFGPFHPRVAYCVVLAATVSSLSLAQTAPAAWAWASAFDAAWRLQPEAQSLQARSDALKARRASTNSWTAEPVALEVSAKNDRLLRNTGTKEYTLGVALPLWLPGERVGMSELADAETIGLQTRLLAAQLRTAATVRESMWAWERARLDLAASSDRLESAKRLANDVGKRVKAGDLSRADQHQADGNVAVAQIAMQESQNSLFAASQQLKAQSNLASLPGAAVPVEPLPQAPPDAATSNASHPAVQDLNAQIAVAKRNASLIGIQGRANPELTISTSRDRGSSADKFNQTIEVGFRMPFGAPAKQQAKTATANAELVELESQLQLTLQRLSAEREIAQYRVQATLAQADTAKTRARLSKETREFFEKSFRMGESDLPTRLRVELDASESERQLARAQIDHAAAVSALRQALGLLPE
jgi:outer membrane protein, heavy metal efflux system